MDQDWDPRGEAATALARALDGFGPQILSRADMLTGLLEDDVPHLPREVALLTAAARTGAAKLITERMQQGLPADQVVAMTATEMTARTAMDASGSRWAVGEFARVLGHPVARPAQPPAPQPPAPPPTPQPQPTPQPVPVPQPTPTPQPVPVPQPTPTPQPTPMPQPVPAPPDSAPARKQAVTAVLACGVLALAPLGWAVLAPPPALSAVFWLDTTVLILGLGVIMVWVARRGRPGGFAAVLGASLPLISYAIYRLATVMQLFSSGFSLTRRHVLEATTWLWLAATVIAASLAVAGLIRGHQFTRPKLAPLTVIMSAVGVGFAFAFILRQDNLNYIPILYSTIGSYVLGPYLHGWRIVWGVVFLTVVSAPPLLALLLRDPGIRVAMWTGWLIFGLAWLLTFTPLYGDTAATGLHVTWILWSAALLGTLLMAAQARAARQAGQPVPVVD